MEENLGNITFKSEKGNSYESWQKKLTETCRAGFEAPEKQLGLIITACFFLLLLPAHDLPQEVNTLERDGPETISEDFWRSVK